MLRSKLATHSVRVLAVPLLVSGAVMGVPSAASAAARGGLPRPAASFTIGGGLSGVAATSGRDAWAVGCTGCGSRPRILILRWNGSAWRRVPSPAPAGGSLGGVAAVSDRSAWAVGVTGSSSHLKTLILRWNGSAWKRVPSPTPRAGGRLFGVAAVSARNAWAVGGSGIHGFSKTLILRWNGSAWRRVPSPAPAGGYLTGVAIVSARNAWAVGQTANFKTLILHWDGSTWKRVRSPSPDVCSGFGLQDLFLFGVAAVSARSAWAVGNSCNSEGNTALILHWNGSTWQVVPSPTPPAGGGLAGVAAVSARGAWAVGGTLDRKTLTERWNGTTWK